jgi:hypothetical protein
LPGIDPYQQVLRQFFKASLVPGGNSVLPGVPERLATASGQLGKASQVVSNLEDCPSIIPTVGDKLSNLVDTMPGFRAWLGKLRA